MKFDYLKPAGGEILPDCNGVPRGTVSITDCGLKARKQTPKRKT
jgi:hypothetical protein